MRDTKVTLFPKALSHNLQRVQQYAPKSKILAMVKANAYGHGIDFALGALQDADGFGVACLQEAVEVLEHGIKADQQLVLIEGAFNLNEWHTIGQHQDHKTWGCVIHHPQQLEWALQHPYPHIQIWLKVNTGMNRLGLSPLEAKAAALALRAKPYSLILTMHFANADEADHPENQKQIDLFLNLKKELEPIAASVCNSAALIQWSHLHFDWVRPGIMLYGSTPFAADHLLQSKSLNLETTMQLSAPIIAMHTLNTGEFVGYGSRWQAQRKTQLAIVGIGYGDGYPRVVGTEAYVAIDKYVMPVIGRVSMDMMMIDITDLPIPCFIGQTVEIWGKTVNVDEIAAAANTIGYELFCRLTARPERVIIKNT